MTRPDARASEGAVWASALPMGLGVLVVALTPLGYALGRDVASAWLAVDTGLVLVVAALMTVRPRLGVGRILIPFAATIAVVAGAAADRAYVGPVHLVVHGLALVVVVAGWLLRGDRGPRPRSPRG